jgi:hypothetical protein
MKKLALSLVLLGLLTGLARAGVLLTTSNPPGSPLAVVAGGTSGPMFVRVSSNGAPNNMANWQFRLLIIPDSGATGTRSASSSGSAEGSRSETEQVRARLKRATKSTPGAICGVSNLLAYVSVT